jgi:exodeoxyribonuclease-3
MTIISWNVNGIRAIIKKDFFETVKKMKPDILCIQETKAQIEEVDKALAQLTDYNLYVNSAAKKGYAGTAILSKTKPIAITNGIGIEGYDNEGRIICAEYQDFYLINVYIPNSKKQLERLDYRKKWDAYFLKYLKKLEKIKPIIVSGDFNVAHQAIDLKNDKANYNKTAGYTQIEIDGMTNMLNEGFVDSFRYLHPHKVAYTYWSYRFKARERNTGWRIDYFLICKSLLKNIKSVDILSQHYGSDHCPIILEIEF